MPSACPSDTPSAYGVGIPWKSVGRTSQERAMSPFPPFSWTFSVRFDHPGLVPVAGNCITPE